MDSDSAFSYLSDAHTAMEEVQTLIATALNCILEVSGTSCQEYRAAQQKMEPVQQCVSAIFDLWEVVAEAEEEHPAPLQHTFGRQGFKFQHWEEVMS